MVSIISFNGPLLFLFYVYVKCQKGPIYAKMYEHFVYHSKYQVRGWDGGVGPIYISFRGYTNKTNDIIDIIINIIGTIIVINGNKQRV